MENDTQFRGAEGAYHKQTAADWAKRYNDILLSFSFGPFEALEQFCEVVKNKGQNQH